MQRARRANRTKDEKKTQSVPVIVSLTGDEVPDRDRRQSVFSGNLFVYSPRASSRALTDAARGRLEQFLGAEPAWAQQRLSEAEFMTLFNAAVRSLRASLLDLAGAIVKEFGCDPESTFIGAVSLVAGTGFGFLAHGLGVPQHPHRDTWYAASISQVNWWVPLNDLDASSSFAFHPLYWDVAVNNSSKDFVFEEWTRVGKAGDHGGVGDRLAEPRPLDPIDLAPEIQISCPAGSVVVSSAAQLWSMVPNETLKTHFNVQFQTVSQADLETGLGASNVDAAPRGTSLATFVRCSDLSPIPQELIERDLDLRRL